MDLTGVQYFECPDWDVFKDTCEDLEELSDAICSYILQRYAHSLKIDPNNRPWTNNSVKACMSEKRRAHEKGLSVYTQANKRLKTELSKTEFRK